MCQQSASQLLSVLRIIAIWFKMLKIFQLRFLGMICSLLSVSHGLNSAFIYFKFFFFIFGVIF